MPEDDLESYWKLLRPKKGGRSRVRQLAGNSFGRLLVLRRQGTDKHGSSTWVCQCSCGNVKVVARRELTSGNVKSCGCLLKEYRSQPKAHLRQGRRVNWPRRFQEENEAEGEGDYEDLSNVLAEDFYD